MQKFTIIRDKKLLWFVIIDMFMSSVAFYISFLSKSRMQRNIYINYNVILVFFLISIVVLHLFLLSKLYQKIKLNGDKVCVGMTSMQTFYCSSVTKIHFTDKIEISFKNIKKNFRIRIIDVDNNEHKYRQLIEYLKENTKVDIDVDLAINALKQQRINKYSTQSGRPIPFGGWLIVLMINLLLSFFGNVSIALINIFTKIMNGDFLSPELFITSLIQLLLVCYVLYKFFTKNKKATYFIKIYFILNISLMIVANLYPVLFNGKSLAISQIMSPINRITEMFIIFRYLSISQRVKHTFVNE